MIAIAAVAIAAGSASALMYVSIISGAAISVVLSSLAPLPLMVAAIGWGSLTAAIGGIAVTLTFGLLFGFPFGFAFAASTALPAWWLGHLVMLGRPAAAGNAMSPSAAGIEWYPTGRLLVWVAAFGAAISLWSLFKISTDADVIAATMSKRFANAIRSFAQRGYAIDDSLADTMGAIAPVVLPILPMILLTTNLWLTGKIAGISGRLSRPWPDLKSTALPPMTLVALCVAIAFCFTGGLVGLIAKVATGAMVTAYGLAGLAVLHTLTLASNNRTAWLLLTYVITIPLMWPLFIVAALGVADAVFGFRERFMRTRPPPLPAA